jgi:hypothetical protein
MSAFEEILVKSYPSFALMELDVVAAAKRDNFVVTRRSTEYASDRMMMKGTFCCYKSGKSNTRSRGTAKTDCPFKIHFRMKSSTNVYAFTPNHHLVHNHAMDPASTVMTAMARRFAPRQLDTIESMHSRGSTVPQIVTELRETTNAAILPKDVYNSLRRSERTHFDGVSEVQTLVSALEGNIEFDYRAVTNDQRQLVSLAFAHRRSLEQFSALSFVLLMDSTYATNKFNMPLLLFSSVDPLGYTYIVACCLLKDETIVSYNTALSSFKQLLGPRAVIIDAIVTDQDRALMRAVETQFPASSHQLCRWHLQMNVKTNVGKNLPLCSKFSRYMHCENQALAEQIYESMQGSASSEESAYLEHLHDLRHRYVEAWVLNYRNLGIRSTQRAESMNHALKRHLNTNSQLVDLFRALQAMIKTQEETRAFNEFQMRDRPSVYSPLISLLRGKVSRFLLELLEGQFSQIKWVRIGSMDEEFVYFTDSHKLSIEGCSCPFFLQYWAPCAHYLMCGGEDAFVMIYSGWIIGDAQVTEPAILHGPRHVPQVSAEDMRRAEAMAKISDVHMRLLDMDTEMAILFTTKIQEMFDRGSLHEPAMIQDPPVSRPRGRPRKPKKNLFRGDPIF